MSKAVLLQSPAMDCEFFTSLRFVEPDDAEFICTIRSDPNLNKHISQSSPEVESQRAWIESYKHREESGEEYYFVIQHQDKPFGVVRMYDFRDNSFCWGSWIIIPSRPSGLAVYSAVAIYEMGFDVLGFNQSHFDVRLENQSVIDFHLRSGAKPAEIIGEDQHFIFSRDNWPAFREASAPQIKKHRLFHG